MITQEFATRLAGATRERRRIPVDDAFRALTRAQAMEVQADTAAALATTVAGWKVAILPEGPAYAPLFASAVREGVQTAWPPYEEGYLVEVEIGFRLARDLPARPGQPYLAQELSDALSHAFVGIELIGSRLKHSPGEAPFPAWLADNMGNGAYVVGPAVAYATVADRLDALGCRVVLDGSTVHERPGHPHGHPLAPFLACLNDQTDRLGGFKAGQIVTTGSLNAPFLVTARGQVEADLAGLGAMTLHIG